MRGLMAALMLITLSGCASNVVTDYNSATEFGSYSSWAFADNNDSSGFVSLDGARVQNAVESELDRKTMKKVADDEADLLVSYRVEKVDRLDTTGLSYGLGLGRGAFGFGFSTAPPVREVQEGKLVVELVDSETSQVVWRGVSKRYLNEDQSPQYRRELIDEVIADMFAKYPPGI